MIGPALMFAAITGSAGACPPGPAPGMVARAAPFGGAIAPTAAQADEAVAAGMLARDASRRYLGTDPPPFLIAGEPRGAPPALGGCDFLFPWKFPPAGESPSRLPSHVLPHEIGHTLFIRFLAPRTGADEYGGGAPDWLDEMAAMAFEDAAGVRMRRNEARRHAERGGLIPLARLLAMPHPEWSARRAAGAAPPQAAMSQPGSPDTPAYYATIRALFDFLIQRTGNERIVPLLAEQARAGAPLDAWLAAHVAPGGAGMGTALLDRQIAGFVLTDPAYREAGRVAAAAADMPT